MTRYRLVVLTNPVAGRDEEYNRWYDEQHLHDVLAVPGFTAAQRFRLADASMADERFPWRYLAIYEVETDDLRGAMEALYARTGTDAMVMSDSLDMDSAAALPFEPIGERVVAD